jgi:hypothetical protein
VRQEDGAPNARSSKEPDGSLLTPPEVFWEEKPASGHISQRPIASLIALPDSGGDRTESDMELGHTKLPTRSGIASRWRLEPLLD